MLNLRGNNGSSRGRGEYQVDKRRMIPEELTTKYDTDMLREFGEDTKGEDEELNRPRDRKTVYRSKGKVGTETTGVKSVSDDLRGIASYNEGNGNKNKYKLIAILISILILLILYIIIF